MRYPFLNKTMSILAAFVLAASCAAAAGCSNGEHVAATVQGEKAYEEDVTAYIDKFRQGIQCNEDDNWAAYLAGRDMTAEQFREMTIQELASPVIVSNKAKELGITVDDSEVEEKVDDVRSALLQDSDDDAWAETLEYYGTTEDDMKDTYRKAILRSKVLKEVIGEVTPTDLDIRNYIEEKLLGTKTKKIKAIYSNDYTKLQKVLRKIQAASSISAGFKEQAKKADGISVGAHNLGWDLDAELTDNMRSTIADITKGHINDTLMSEDGMYYIFYVEGVYAFPKKISKLGKLDESLRSSVSGLAATELQTSAGNVWLKQQIADNTQINPMPDGLSYDVEVMNAGVDDASASDGKGSESSAEISGDDAADGNSN